MKKFVSKLLEIISKPIAWLLFFWIAATLLLRECGSPVEPPEDHKTDTIIQIIYKTDTLSINNTVYYPVYDTVFDSVPVFSLDTAQVFDDYYKYRVYNENLWKDSLADLNVRAVVWKNELIFAKLHGEIFRTTIIKTEVHEHYIKEKSVRKLYVGIQAKVSYDNLGVVPTLMFQTKKDHLYSAGYDPFNKSVYAGTYFKIRF